MIDPAYVQAAVVAAFLFAAVLAARLAVSASSADPRLWGAAAVVLVALAVDRQFGVLAAVTDAARQAAVDAGWYDERRLFQRWLVLGLGAAGMLGFAAWTMRRRRRLSMGAAMTTAAVVFLVCLALARASSQHRVDAFLRERAVLGLRWQPALELLGAIAAAAGAATALRGARRRGSAQRLPNRAA